MMTSSDKFYRGQSFGLRLISVAVAALQTVLPISTQVWATERVEIPKTAEAAPAQQHVKVSPLLLAEAPVVKVNRTVPKVEPPSTDVEFSSTPSDGEFRNSRVFSEPLLPVEKATTVRENQALAKALKSFASRTAADDFTALQEFLDGFPDSAWRASLLAQLGIVYRRNGYFSLALNVWEEAWKQAKGGNSVEAHAVADYAVGELAALSSRLGRYERLEALFQELEQRPARGAAAEKIEHAREAFWMMKHEPETSFRCGPFALDRIRGYWRPQDALHPKIVNSKSTLKGIALTDVCALANELNMGYQMARREPGAELVLPAVVHWKANHYAALIREENGKYLMQDRTFGDDLWVSRAALEEEASGYFLVRKGDLPKGWEPIDSNHGNTIYGKGLTGGRDPRDFGPCDPKSGDDSCGGGSGGGGTGGFHMPPGFGSDPGFSVGGSFSAHGMARYAVHSLAVSLNLVDTPVGYTPPRGPAVFFTVTYNQVDSYQPQTFAYSNLGNKWTYNWLAYVIDQPLTPTANSDCYLPSGGVETYTSFNTNTQMYATHYKSRAQLVRTSSTSYERRLPDGSKQVYSLSNGATTDRKVFMTSIVDPQGNTVSLTYDGSYRLTAITDAIGQVTTISYALGADTLKITKVTDPFGRYATFTYNTNSPIQLVTITDVIGLNSQFTYSTSPSKPDFVDSLITPYGTNSFDFGVPVNTIDRYVEVTDPYGQKERTEWKNGDYTFYTPNTETDVPTFPSPWDYVQNASLRYRNTYFWDKRAMAQYPNVQTNAQITHWLHNTFDTTCSGIKESEKKPLENRVWYVYAGQSDSLHVGTNTQPSCVARVLDDGSSQIYLYDYDDFGNTIKATDPAGRVTSYVYSTNLIDLLEIRQTTGTNNELLATFTYNSAHRPLTTVDAAGQTNKFGYNSYGQLLAVTNARNETATFSYDSNGYLQSVAGAQAGATTSYTYDGYGRVRTVTDSEGYSVVYDYDALNRPTRTTYLDGTFEQIAYNNLDAVQRRDRLGRTTTLTFDALDRLTQIVDGLGRTNVLGWCDCGSLSTLTDARGQTTTWSRDLQGRVTSKLFPDGTQKQYAYEAKSSRLQRMTDARNQSTLYQYFTDNNLKQISYSNAVIATPTVSFLFDGNYNRLTNMVDGVGTNVYGYNAITTSPALGAGRLASIDGSLTNDTVSYTYDELGRVTTHAINSVTVKSVFDSLGRVTSLTNALGSFSYSYLNTTPRLNSITNPVSQTTTFGYFSNVGDQRLQQIQHALGNGTVLSKLNYGYTETGQINSWTQQTNAGTPTVMTFEYDAAEQLLSGVQTVNGSVSRSYAYGYDAAGNRTSEQIDSGVSQATYNTNNQLTATQSGGPLLFRGHVNEPARVIIAGNQATLRGDLTFSGPVSVSAGTNVVAIIATDGSGNKRTNSYQVVVTNNVGTKTLSYDLNGNLTTVTNGATVTTYEWDAADRLMAVNQGNNRSEFTYDGLGRRVRIVEKVSNSVTSDKRFVWCGTELCEERDSAGGTVSKRYFGQGMQLGGTNLFYTRDHLGSVREMVDTSGNIRVRYDYDPFGRRSKVSGDLDADFGFTGHYFHTTSGLHLALYRAYDAEAAKWLSCDPIEEQGGLNFYRYVGNDPVNYIDSLGLAITGESYCGILSGAGSISINGKSYVVTTKAEFLAALKTSTAGGDKIQTFTYSGHGYPDQGGLSWAANKDPVSKNGYISPQELQIYLEHYKALFDPNVRVELKSCGSANPNTFSSADAFKCVFPGSRVSGYTGLYLPCVGGVWNNSYFAHNGGFPNTPYNSSWITK